MTFTEHNTYPFLAVFHSTLAMGRHASGFPSFPVLAAKTATIMLKRLVS